MPVNANDKHVNLGDRVLLELVYQASAGQVFKVKSTAVKEKSLVISICRLELLPTNQQALHPLISFYFFVLYFHCIYYREG